MKARPQPAGLCFALLGGFADRSFRATLPCLNRLGYVTLNSGGAFLSQVRVDGGRWRPLLQTLRSAADPRAGSGTRAPTFA